MNDLLDDHLIEERPTYDFKISIAALWSFPWIFGQLFRTMHWPGAGLLILIGAAGLMAYSISGFLTHKGKNLSNNISILIAAFYIIRYGYTVYVWGGHFDFIFTYAIILAILLVTNLRYKKKKYGSYS